MLFGKETLWIHILEDDSFAQVLRSDLEEDMPESKHAGMSYVRYIAIAARIKEEMAQKRLLSPYESSLIPLPHQILVLEKVMQGVQTRFMLADEVGMGKTIEAGLVRLALLNNALPVLALKISERLKCVDYKQRKKNGQIHLREGVVWYRMLNSF
jgi:hypothetical protein